MEPADRSIQTMTPEMVYVFVKTIHNHQKYRQEHAVIALIDAVEDGVVNVKYYDEILNIIGTTMKYSSSVDSTCNYVYSVILQTAQSYIDAGLKTYNLNQTTVSKQ